MTTEHGNPLAEVAPVGSKIMILFASETGTAEEFAFDLGNALQSNHFNCEVCDLDDYQAENLTSERLTILVSSTYGNGEAPYNGESFYEWLETQEPDLRQLSFAVCALGDTGYPSFAQAGKDFDRFLEEAGGTRILPRVELDACFDQSIEPFIELVQTWLQEYGDSFKK
jgi:sulfite reductase (NADPH) flavoprotein alpha-component